MAGNFNFNGNNMWSTIGSLAGTVAGVADNFNVAANRKRQSNVDEGFYDSYIYGDNTGQILPFFDNSALGYTRAEANSFTSPLYSDTPSLAEQWENIKFKRMYDENVNDPGQRALDFLTAGFSIYDPNRGGRRFDLRNASTALKGFSTGAQIGDKWGGVAGAIVGGLSDIAQRLTEGNRIRKVNSVNNYYNDMAISAYNNSVFNSGLNRNLAYDRQYSALGGPLNTNGGDFTTGLKDIAAGSTHELNPYGGVLMGMDREGNPNFVEEGEQIYNDYVYSARMEMPDELADKYHLQKKTTFADGIKKLHEEYEERPNDVISRDGFNVIASEFAQTQEILRQMQQAQEVENRYKCGGKMKKFAGGGPFTEEPPQGLKLGYFDTEISDYSDAPDYYIAKMREIPTFFEYKPSPYTAEDIVLKPVEYEDRYNKFKSILEPENTDYVPVLPIDFDTDDAAIQSVPNKRHTNLKDVKWGRDLTGSTTYPTKSQHTTSEEAQGNFAQRAALAHNLISLLNNLRPVDYHNANRIDKAYRSINSNMEFTPINRTMNYEALNPETYISPLRSSMAATRSAITDLAGGNRATRAAMLLGAERNYADNLGKTLEAIEKSNLEQRKAVTDFNRATESANASMGMQAQVERLKAQEIIAQGLAHEAAFRDALEARRSQAIGNAFNTLTQTLQGIGKENFIYNQLKSAGYDYAYEDRNGNIIYRSPEGKLVSEKDAIDALNAAKSLNKTEEKK